MKHAKRAAFALVVGLATMGSECINDPFLVSVNLEEIEITVPLAAGTTTTYAGSNTVTSNEYLSTAFGSLQNLRIYNITVQTVGTYTGTVTGSASVNGTQLVSYTGNWSQYATPQSLLTDPGLTLNAAGVTALQNAVESESAVTVSSAGSVSVSPVPAGLQVIVRVFAQIDAQP